MESRIKDCPLHGVNLPLECSPIPFAKKKKERKKTLSIDAVVVVFFFASKVSCSESFEREQ